jgi:NDP-sugar pyrophosphorylase family protein
MILAAGLGTRLRHLTNDRPKALMEISGRTLLEIALMRLRDFGIHEVIINVHHFADKVIEHLRQHGNFGMDIEISREDVLLDTGGGLKKAAHFFAGETEPFLLHNVDVISTIDLGRMVQQHKDSGALATLAVQQRKTSRYLLFDPQLQLCGRRFEREQRTEWARPTEQVEPLAFSGIHVISPNLLPRIEEEGVFSIIPVYLRLAATGEKIQAFRADEYYWRDLGTPESLAKAAEELPHSL